MTTRLTAFTATWLFCGAALAGSAKVEFIAPDHYTDAGYSSPVASQRERAEVRREIERHLQELAQRNLPVTDTLKVDVLDIDLAGRFEPFRFRNTSDVRVVSEITWPRIRLRYTLARDSQVLASAEEQVADLNYLLAGNRYANDRLRYEKTMLDDWFERRIAKP